MNDTKVKVRDEHLFSSSMSPGYKETNYCKKKKKKMLLKQWPVLKAPLRQKELCMQFLVKE